MKACRPQVRQVLQSFLTQHVLRAVRIKPSQGEGLSGVQLHLCDERLTKGGGFGVRRSREKLPADHEKQQDRGSRSYSSPASYPSPRGKQRQDIGAHFIDALDRSLPGDSQTFVKTSQGFHLPLTGSAHFQVFGHGKSVVSAEFVIHERAQQFANIFTFHGPESFLWLRRPVQSASGGVRAVRGRAVT